MLLLAKLPVFTTCIIFQLAEERATEWRPVHRVSDVFHVVPNAGGQVELHTEALLLIIQQPSRFCLQ